MTVMITTWFVSQKWSIQSHMAFAIKTFPRCSHKEVMAKCQCLYPHYGTDDTGCHPLDELLGDYPGDDPRIHSNPNILF